jgi:hypothetical protein
MGVANSLTWPTHLPITLLSETKAHPHCFLLWVSHTVTANHTITANFMIFKAIHKALAGYLKNNYHY